MTVFLGLLVVLWLIVLWFIVCGLLGFALFWLAVLVWRVTWAVVGFLVRLVDAIVCGPVGRRA
jgi:hypothetical protein